MLAVSSEETHTPEKAAISEGETPADTSTIENPEVAHVEDTHAGILPEPASHGESHDELSQQHEATPTETRQDERHRPK